MGSMAGWRPQFLRSWHFSKIFPTKWSVMVFLAYMTVFIDQGILVTASRTADNTYPYNTVALVMVTEVLKLLVATMLYLKDNSFKELVRAALRDKRVLLLYLVPASLYCLYNNLQFVNLAVYDPTTYYLLLQFRVVITGGIFQVLFKKTLSRLQWLSLLLLTVGCVIKHMKYDTHVRDVVSFGSQSLSVHLNADLLHILLQVFCSCFAESIDSILQPAVMLVILNQTAIGIITSLFLKSFNSILKTFASALELMFTAVLCWYIFGIPIDIFTFISIVIVCLATFLYSLNPVVIKTSTRHTSDSSDSKQNGFVV
ncbi:SLC35A1 [Branchiostoma lanceolatum]|uniref:SLC35A1 protein n=1 Tax=Branchiostoma lanceolatum TaxID=7740 RepID=A0A8K0A3J0_BRALA|nr:SLC35A1 [Branchiostoma lanceolatum]